MNTVSIASLRGVGPQIQTRLEKLGIYTLQDLLFHLPLRYEDRTRITPIQETKLGDHVIVEGDIKQVNIRLGRRRSLLCTLTDTTGWITLRFFHFSTQQQAQLERPHVRVRCFGEIRNGATGFEMVHPEYRFVDMQTPFSSDHRLTPIYPTTEGLNQTIFRRLTEQALSLMDTCHVLQELLPSELLAQLRLPDLKEAIRHIHRPSILSEKLKHTLPDKIVVLDTKAAQKRLAFEELLAHRLSLQKKRLCAQQFSAPSFYANTTLLTHFIAQLPFKLTQAQTRVIREIQEDLKQSFPMLRLVQGDVGSGKTIVAAMGALQVIAQNYQVVLMAPTELLADQHAKNFEYWLSPMNIQVTALTGTLKASARREALSDIASGKAQMIVGTHALFQKEVVFNRLGLVIIDEQHRFGVHQRLSLHKKGQIMMQHPHQLIMTATPIPRTLAMTAYADLDVSVIDELPPGRTPIETALISNARRDEVIAHIAEACMQGRQAYWVCTLIEESEVLQCQAAEVTAALLAEKLPHIRLVLIHGRLKSQEKEARMQAFKSGEAQLLVATTVIEVGVDVPNASLMIIENAERLGLAQLHQLRGRVGRGHIASHCVLLYQHPLSILAQQRLYALKKYKSGFDIAQKDLDIRGPGEILGTRQAGAVTFKIADLARDAYLLSDIYKASQTLLSMSTDRVDAIIHRWIGVNQRYSQV